MGSRSIAPVLLLSMASLTAVPAAIPALAEDAAAPGMTVAEAAQRVDSEQASVDAEIGLLQTHLAVLDVDEAASRVEADGVRSLADAYLDSSEAQRLKSKVADYDASCTNRVLIGGQGNACGAASVKLGKLVAGYNQAAAEFGRRLDAQSRRAQRIRTEIAQTRARIQTLKTYAAWLRSARETLAEACGGGSPGETERRCGRVRFDSLRADLPPCDLERCPAWTQPWSLRPRNSRRRLRFGPAGGF